jgi:4-hydroxy-tetrahydrodipicolinate reductase
MMRTRGLLLSMAVAVLTRPAVAWHVLGRGSSASMACAQDAARRAANPRASADGDVAIMVNGLPGAMGLEIAAACLRREGVTLAPFALTGPTGGGTVDVGGVTVQLFGAEGREEAAARVKEAYPEPGALLCIDFTHPSAVNDNAAWYCAHGLPFVMGTTGGDRAALMEVTRDSGTYAVIAPNMAKQIVALQAALEQMGDEFAGSFAGYTLSVVESHQSTKADTSGTAKAVSTSLAKLTNEDDFGADDYARIVRVRELQAQRDGGGPSHKGVSPVPDAALDGHAFHTYALTSADGAVEFQIRHNVQGRSTYAEGSVDAAVFLARCVRAATAEKVYDMVDVLRQGGM